MSSLPEMYNDREIESPFSFRADEYDGKGELLHKGYSYRESMGAAMPSFARIQKMHLTERFFTKRMLYILQFLYELGPLTAKEIEWAFLHPKVEPYERKIGVKDPYRQELLQLLNHGLLVKCEVTDNGRKRMRCFRLAPSMEQYYRSGMSISREDIFSEHNATESIRLYDLPAVLRAVSASMYALRVCVYQGHLLTASNRRFMEMGMMFDGKYLFENGIRHYVLSVRNMAAEYGNVLDAMMLPAFKKDMNYLLVITESMEKAQELRKLLLAKGLSGESGILYTTDLALRNESAPALYTIDDDGYEIRRLEEEKTG